MQLCLRFDVDTEFGLTERVPPLLELLDSFGVRATFFCVLGPEASLRDLVRLRLFHTGPREPVCWNTRGGRLRALRACIGSSPKVERHPELLRSIRARGHEVQPHGWKHITWQRALEQLDLDAEIARICSGYERVFGVRPIGFASPGRRCMERSMRALEAAGFRYLGDLDGDSPFRPVGYRHWQAPITLFRTFSQLRSEGRTHAQVADRLIAHLEQQRRYACLYEHPEALFEAELAVLRRVLEWTRAERIEPVTVSEALETLTGEEFGWTR